MDQERKIQEHVSFRKIFLIFRVKPKSNVVWIGVAQCYINSAGSVANSMFDSDTDDETLKYCYEPESRRQFALVFFLRNPSRATVLKSEV